MHTSFKALCILFASVFFIITNSHYTNAEQLDFSKHETSSTIEYSYQWKDKDDTIQQLNFALDKRLVGNNYRHFKALRPSLLRMYSIRELKKAIAKLDPRKGSVKLLPRVEDIEFEISSRDTSWIKQTSQQLKKVYEQSLKNYLAKELYIEFDDFRPLADTVTFKPDHVRFILEQPEPIQPLIEALKQKRPNATPREMASFLLGWIQTIPYDEMVERATSNGAGFVPPIHLINQNKGDCDSKVTLMAHIMRQLYPNLRMAIIYLPQHALLGMNISYLQDDKTIEIDGYDYALLEPVGPALIGFADAAESSLRYIDSKMYRTELVKLP
ncbi:hypothetical protein J1N51_05455 [Psychrosphaera ytuae]|uniref:Transglutaminase-like domain-containing protein n=1 Tax=Psychrosphaera ytuae TaxID=2820710 RepID=A0A975DD02_9GAMM|nr:hypothetical protein [Psychrosphaera ytuae]QTH64895.1 hypothetical protein J1N51_05455 [Psychrosphaera ytuae]